MGQMGSWNGYVFEVSGSVVRGYTGLTIEGGSEVENKVSNKYAYVNRKNSTPTTVSIEVQLNAYLGCDVRAEAMEFIQSATDGDKNYFYVAGKKLVTCQLMLTNAKVTETVMTPAGEWISCKIALTMKQCEKYSSGSSSSKSSSSSKKSTQSSKKTVKQQSYVETGNTEKTETKNATEEAKNAIDRIVQSATSAAQNWIKTKVDNAKQVIANAKATTTTQKNTTTKKTAAKTAATSTNKVESVGKHSKQ